MKEEYENFYKHTFTGEKTNLGVKNSLFPRNRIESIYNYCGKFNTIMDIGCGDGYLLEVLSSKYKNCIGLEYSPNRLHLAEKRLENFHFKGLVGSAENLLDIMDSNSVDCVVSADTIEHIPNVYAACDEMYRILKPGGTLIINTPNTAFIKKRIQLLFGRFPSTSSDNEGLGGELMFDGGHLHYFTFRSLKLLLKRSGFEIIKSNGYGDLGFFHAIYPPLLSGGIQIIAKK